MSYCRPHRDSDFYVYQNLYFKFVVHGPQFREFDTAQQTLDYLNEQKSKGFKVPDEALERLQEDIKRDTINNSIKKNK